MAYRENVAEKLLDIKAYFAGQAIEAKEEIVKEVFVEAQQTIDNAISMLKDPEAVVLCKDCKHRSDKMYDYYGNKNNKVYVCQINDLAKKPNWYCADGERKEGR